MDAFAEKLGRIALVKPEQISERHQKRIPKLYASDYHWCYRYLMD